eukprot:3436174-Alexandrium_andersonii.AAC.1
MPVPAASTVPSARCGVRRVAATLLSPGPAAISTGYRARWRSTLRARLVGEPGTLRRCGC